MHTNARFPYGISNFEKLISEGAVFVDKTAFLSELEKTSYGIFLRPRRFGKSLFLSMLEYYYDIRHKENFSKLFGRFAIGRQPTPLANSYRVLLFNFSGIDTRTPESSYVGFVASVRNSIIDFFAKNAELLSVGQQTQILETKSAEQLLGTLVSIYPKRAEKLYVLIDEYDHFTNEILWRNVEDFKDSVSKNGYVRKFYEVLKNATQQGVVDRFLITGVSSITLDSLTSGFNIVTHLTKSRELHDLMGFTTEEVQQLLELALEDHSRLGVIMDELKAYYNGYKFNKRIDHTLYNSDMVLYFVDSFQKTQEFPDQMLDPNIMPDYGKLKKMFEVANWHNNTEVLETVLQEGEIASTEIYQFGFEKNFGRAEFVNFLYYLGNLTFAGEDMVGMPLYKIPNKVIGELYWQYYADVLQRWADLPMETDSIIPAVRQMALGDERAFFGLIQKLLEALSNRDFQKFEEKHVKAFIIAYAMQAGIFLITSERELSSGYYPDIEMSVRPGLNRRHHEYLIEVKYLSAKDKRKLKATQAEARAQLETYMSQDDLLGSRPLLRAFSVVVVKDKLYVQEVKRG